MSAPKIQAVYAGGALLALIVVGLVAKKIIDGIGAASDAVANPNPDAVAVWSEKTAKSATKVVTGTALGVTAAINDALGIPTTSEVIAAANSTSNPLQPVGSWIGTTIYDLTH